MKRFDRLSRRGFVGLVTVGGVGVLAGCLDGEDPNGGDGDETGGSPDDYDPVDHSGDEPIEFPDDYRCPVCNMIPVEYSSTNAQLAHENGHGKFFDSAGCLFAYYADPEAYDGPDSAVVGAWATGYESGELIDATEAYFVLDIEEYNDPMDSPVPFEAREDAVDYVDDRDHVSEDDIAGLEDADSDAAAPFR